MASLGTKAFSQVIYASDAFEFIRTVPKEKGDKDFPFVGYIMTTRGEAEVLYNNNTLCKVLAHGDEITKEEYDAEISRVKKRMGNN